MSNPARELHEVYSEWRAKADASSTSMIDLIDPRTAAGAHEILRAARLLARIDEIIVGYTMDGRDDVAVYRRQFPEWLEGMLALRAGWTTIVSAESIATQETMDQIAGFANFLDGKVYEFSDDDLDSLRGILEKARDVLATDVGLEPTVRSYLHRLLQEIQYALDDEAIGASVDFTAAAQRLWVAFRAAEQVSTENSSLWSALAQSFVVNEVTSAAIEGGRLAIMMAPGG